MSTITNETRLRLISRLSPLSTVESTDLHVLQRGLKTYKIEHGSLEIDDANVTYDGGLTGSTVHEALEDIESKLGVLDPIDDYKFLGNVSGGSATPIALDILDEDDLVSDSDTAVATQQSIRAYVDERAGDVRAPFYQVAINANDSYVNPTEFVSNLAEFSEISYGSIMHPTSEYYTDNSFLYSMNVFASAGTTVTFKIFATDDEIYFWVNGGIGGTYTTPNYTQGNHNSSNSPATINMVLPAGASLIEIVKNNSGGGTQRLQMFGDIIQSGINFVKP